MNAIHELFVSHHTIQLISFPKSGHRRFKLYIMCSQNNYQIAFTINTRVRSPRPLIKKERHRRFVVALKCIDPGDRERKKRFLVRMYMCSTRPQPKHVHDLHGSDVSPIISGGESHRLYTDTSSMKEHWRLAHLHLPVYMSGVRKDVIQDHIESVRETSTGSNDLRLEVGSHRSAQGGQRIPETPLYLQYHRSAKQNGHRHAPCRLRISFKILRHRHHLTSHNSDYSE